MLRFLRTSKENDHLEHLGIDSRIILKLILKNGMRFNKLTQVMTPMPMPPPLSLYLRNWLNLPLGTTESIPWGPEVQLLSEYKPAVPEGL